MPSGSVAGWVCAVLLFLILLAQMGVINAR
jgi:hypothetical protein